MKKLNQKESRSTHRNRTKATIGRQLPIKFTSQRLDSRHAQCIESMLPVSPPLLLIQTPASRVPHSWCCGHPGPPSRSKGLQCWRLATRAGPVVRTVDAVTAAYCQCGSLLGGAEVGTNTAGHRPYMDRLTGYFFISRAVLLYPSERGAHVEQNGNR